MHLGCVGRSDPTRAAMPALDEGHLALDREITLAVPGGGSHQDHLRSREYPPGERDETPRLRSAPETPLLGNCRSRRRSDSVPGMSPSDADPDSGRAGSDRWREGGRPGCGPSGRDVRARRRHRIHVERSIERALARPFMYFTREAWRCRRLRSVTRFAAPDRGRPRPNPCGACGLRSPTESSNLNSGKVSPQARSTAGLPSTPDLTTASADRRAAVRQVGPPGPDGARIFRPDVGGFAGGWGETWWGVEQSGRMQE